MAKNAGPSSGGPKSVMLTTLTWSIFEAARASSRKRWAISGSSRKRGLMIFRAKCLVEVDVAGEEHDAHAAGAEAAHDLVAALDDLADQVVVAEEAPELGPVGKSAVGLGHAPLTR